VQLGKDEDGIILMPNTDSPVLPEWGQSHEIKPNQYLSDEEKEKAAEDKKLKEEEKSLLKDEPKEELKDE